jgi:protein-tyrosine sulfotransferase
MRNQFAMNEESPPARHTAHSAEPVFIHGILPRSGTNFLWDLLLLHRDLSRSRDPVNEDLFLDHSDHLVSFVDAVHAAWDPRWGTFEPDLRDRLYSGIGDGLVAFLWSDRSRRLVTKSPSVRHLDRFFAFFPGAQLLILVRDGRAVVQSAVDTFGWDFDRACRAWAEAARTIQRFQHQHSQSTCAARWRLVRYEDLVDGTVTQLRGIFEFLGLDPNQYDFDAARNLPVRGSSSYGRHDGKVHWNAVPKGASFTPNERWRSWSAARIERFDWLAGEELVGFGYAVSRIHFTPARALVHTLRDWQWSAATTVRRLIYRARGCVALRSRLASVFKHLRTRTSPR